MGELNWRLGLGGLGGDIVRERGRCPLVPPVRCFAGRVRNAERDLIGRLALMKDMISTGEKRGRVCAYRLVPRHGPGWTRTFTFRECLPVAAKYQSQLLN